MHFARAWKPGLLTQKWKTEQQVCLLCCNGCVALGSSRNAADLLLKVSRGTSAFLGYLQCTSRGNRQSITIQALIVCPPLAKHVHTVFADRTMLMSELDELLELDEPLRFQLQMLQLLAQGNSFLSAGGALQGLVQASLPVTVATTALQFCSANTQSSKIRFIPHKHLQKCRTRPCHLWHGKPSTASKSSARHEMQMLASLLLRSFRLSGYACCDVQLLSKCCKPLGRLFPLPAAVPVIWALDCH